MRAPGRQLTLFGDDLELMGAGEAGAGERVAARAGSGARRKNTRDTGGELAGKPPRKPGPPALVINKNISEPRASSGTALEINNNKHARGYVRQAEYRLSPRVFLRAGDKIRVSGGPYYEAHDAAGNVVKTKMAERGVMIFLGYCESGTSRWIEAHGTAGFAALHIGPEEISSEIPGLVRRPYRITKVRAKNRPGGAAQPRRRKSASRTPACPRRRKARLQGGA